MKAIDVHGHFGPYDRGLGTRVDRFMSATADGVALRGVDCDIEMTVMSAIHGLIHIGAMQFRAMPMRKPAPKTIRASGSGRSSTRGCQRPTNRRTVNLSHPSCMGIKIHPHAHQFEIREFGAQIFSFADERNSVVLTHSGDVGSYPEDFVPFANRHANVQLILAHLGNSDDGSVMRQVQAIQHGRNGNLWVDTSSARSMFSGLIEWAVEQIGEQTESLRQRHTALFGRAQKGRIETADIDDSAKQAILWDNAAGLFGLSAR